MFGHARANTHTHLEGQAPHANPRIISWWPRQDVIPRSAGIRTHLARGAARADFLLESDPRNFGGIAGQESGFAYWAAGEKPKIYLGEAEIPL